MAGPTKATIERENTLLKAELDKVKRTVAEAVMDYEGCYEGRVGFLRDNCGFSQEDIRKYVGGHTPDHVAVTVYLNLEGFDGSLLDFKEALDNHINAADFVREVYVGGGREVPATWRAWSYDNERDSFTTLDGKEHDFKY